MTLTREFFLSENEMSIKCLLNSHYQALCSKLEVTEMKMSRWACGHTQRDHVRNDEIRERLKVENFTERCRKATLGGLEALCYK